MIRVALDAMGSDNGFVAAVEGAAALSREEVDISVLLVGNEADLTTALETHKYDPTRIEVVHAAGTITMEEKPRDALRDKPDASISVASQLVADGEADALVSGGSTGAVILASAAAFNRLPGIRRAALAAVHPTEQRHGPKEDPFALILDVGATVVAKPEDLVGFAVMGSAYSKIISDIARPKVALLSNGTEAKKGTPAIVEAHQVLLAHPGLNFVGNVEGLDIPRGTVDVVVCDGFTGNVVLKMLEGVSEVIVDLAKDAYARKFLWKLGLAALSSGIREIRRMTDWKQYGGAPLLGLDHVVIKAHGRSNARALRNAVKVAAKAVDKDLIGTIRQGMAEVQSESSGEESQV
jgi:glycerol-3-phosphate acyltransferase PlsX